MRKLIIGLAIFFYILAAIIILKALDTTPIDRIGKNSTKEQISKKKKDKFENLLGQFAREHEANRTLVKKLQSTIKNLEKNFAKESSKRTVKVLAILGGHFNSAQTIANENLRSDVEQLVSEIQAAHGFKVVIEGHTDNKHVSSSSTKRYMDNMELSFLRAKVVANILVKNGIPLERLTVIGYGHTRPLESNKTRKGRAQNRRVEIKLIPDGQEG